MSLNSGGKYNSPWSSRQQKGNSRGSVGTEGLSRVYFRQQIKAKGGLRYDERRWSEGEVDKDKSISGFTHAHTRKYIYSYYRVCIMVCLHETVCVCVSKI